MFNFTTTTVINNNADFTNPDSQLFSAKAGVLKVKRHLNFKKENVLSVNKAQYVEPDNDEIVIDCSKLGVSTGDTLRLALYIRLSMSNQNSYYSNDLVFKGKPLYCEFIAGTTADKTASALVNAFKKYQIAVYEKPIVKVEVSDDDNKKVIITGTDEFQRFTKVEIEKYTEVEGHPLQSGFKALTLTDGTVTVTPGTEGFGNYRWLLHNFRLPTAQKTSWAAINQDEMPVVGGKYNQYTIKYCVKRGVMGGDAVGEVTKSVTTHVFYVESKVATEFETALTTAFGAVEYGGSSLESDLSALAERVKAIEDGIEDSNA